MPRSRLRSVAGLAWTAFRAFQLRRQYRNAAHMLDRLDDNMLKDMGISRADARAESRKHFWQE